MKTKILWASFLLLFPTGAILAQTQPQTPPQGRPQQAPRSYLEMPWKAVATMMPEEWYGSDEAKATADLLLIHQRFSGGWTKNTNFHQPLSRADSSATVENKRLIDATFDNDGTTTEIRFLAKVYKKTGIYKYRKAMEDGLLFIFQAQYPNGGWPQVWPLKPGYYSHITVNDNAMVNNMILLREVYEKDPAFDFLDNFFVERSRVVFDRAAECLLKLQIVKNGKPTVWCAQHDEYHFYPASGRSYELPSFSGAESVGVVELLMSFEDPSPEVIRAVDGAVEWYRSHRIEGIRVENYTNAQGQRDRHVVEDVNAPGTWGRFYDLDTEKPFFCDRDGVKKTSLEQIGIERRTGYSWYTAAPQALLDAYPAWAAKWKKVATMDRRWMYVATQMPADWYGSAESKQIAENILLYQRPDGGWPKNIEMHRPISDEVRTALANNSSDYMQTLDNNATTTEMKFMARMYGTTKDIRYRKSFERGLECLFKAQYSNGGFPQYYPLREGYYTHITYNDDCMVNILEVLRDISTKQPLYAFVATPENVRKSKAAFDKGIECILKTQVVVNGQPTVWCAQHDEVTLAPTNARAYELPSFSGLESTGILQLLMEIPNPSKEVIASVKGGVKWLDDNKISGIRYEGFTNAEGKYDRHVVNDPSSAPWWARFYDIETGKPFFCGRDGIKRATLAEIEHERRSNYGWYVRNPQAILDAYPAWATKWNVN